MTNEKKMGYKLNITARTLTITKEFALVVREKFSDNGGWL